MSSSVNPMHQFELKNFVNIEFFGHNFSITNGTIVLCFTFLLSLLFAFLLKRSNKLISIIEHKNDLNLNINKNCYKTHLFFTTSFTFSSIEIESLSNFILLIRLISSKLFLILLHRGCTSFSLIKFSLQN